MRAFNLSEVQYRKKYDLSHAGKNFIIKSWSAESYDGLYDNFIECFSNGGCIPIILSNEPGCESYIIYKHHGSTGSVTNEVNSKLYENLDDVYKLPGWTSKKTDFIHDLSKTDDLKRVLGAKLTKHLDVYRELKYKALSILRIHLSPKSIVIIMLIVKEKKSALKDIIKRLVNYFELKIPLLYSTAETGNLSGTVSEIIENPVNLQNNLNQESKMAALGQIAAGIAHEINQPLTGISMGIGNILMRLLKKQYSHEYLENKCKSILEYVARIKGIIDHVKLFSHNYRDDYLHEFNINKCTKNALTLLSVQYKNIHVKCEFDKNISNVYGNIYRFEQVILNILANAYYAIQEKHGESRTKIKDGILLKTYQKKNNVFLEITDYGTGIDKNILEQIFNPFFTTKPPDQGTGLGLSISFNVIKDMNGRIKIISKKGSFSTVLVMIPASK